MHKLPRSTLTLEKRAATLRTMLTQSATEYQLIKAAGRVREARVQLLSAKIGTMPSVLPTPAENRRIAKLECQIAALNEIAPDAILAEFQRTQLKVNYDS